MVSLRVGDRLTVVMPDGEIADTVVEVLELPTALGVATVRCERAGLVVVYAGLGYQLRQTLGRGRAV